MAGIRPVGSTSLPWASMLWAWARWWSAKEVCIAPTRPCASWAALTRLLHELQREQRLPGDPFGHRQARRFQFGAARDMVHHAQPMRLGRRDPVGGEQELLGLADAHLPGMREELGPAPMATE